MQIYAQILVISLARPATPCNDGCVPSTVDTLIPLRLSLFVYQTSFSLARGSRIVSLYHCVCGARFNSESAFFPSRRASTRDRVAIGGGGERATTGDG